MSKPMACDTLYLLRYSPLRRKKLTGSPELAPKRSSRSRGSGPRPLAGLHPPRPDVPRAGSGPSPASLRRRRRIRQHGPDHVPGVGRNEPDLSNLDPEALGGHSVRLGRRLQALHGIGRENLLEVVAQARVVYLGVGYLLRRVR